MNNSAGRASFYLLIIQRIVPERSYLSWSEFNLALSGEIKAKGKSRLIYFMGASAPPCRKSEYKSVYFRINTINLRRHI